jgi:hypothetical protein
VAHLLARLEGDARPRVRPPCLLVPPLVAGTRSSELQPSSAAASVAIVGISAGAIYAWWWLWQNDWPRERGARG